MFPKIYPSWKILISELAHKLYVLGHSSTTEKWQGKQGREMQELLNICFTVQNHDFVEIAPNLPWADEHFKERVSGLPFNPPPSHKIWPFATNINKDFTTEEKFSHTYPERFWPKFAGNFIPTSPSKGIRFNYGDLNDVIKLLITEPNTRQAYVPIWFPEDTGVIEGQRVPCSIGYQFYIRDSILFCHYTMRSCDFLLHFRDDMYMAIKLMFYIISQMDGYKLYIGPLTVSIDNLHCFIEGKEKLVKIWKG